MSDPETLGVYNAQAQQYANLYSDDRDPQLEDFIAACPAGSRVLDLGCGPGHAAARMAAAGLSPVATDASSEMVALASKHVGVTAITAGFDDLNDVAAYHGVWAAFSLLHAPREKFADHLAQIHRALVAGGVFHIRMKQGTGAKRDKLGRFYTYYQPDALNTYLQEAGFTKTAQGEGRTVGLDGEPADWVWITSNA